MKNYIFVLCLICFTFFSCEEQMIPIPERPTSTEGRVMLIEDITGVSCVPCHNANVYVNNLLKESNGAVVAYAIHNGSLSTPHSNSKYDFRYPDVRELESTVDYIGQPSGMFNRVTQANGRIAQSNPSTWQPYVDAELTKPNFLKIEMSADYNTGSRTAEIEIEIVPLSNISGETNIHVVMTENKLIDPQSTPEGVVEDYEHNHVMKESLTGVNGQFLANDLVAFESVIIPFTYTIPAEENGEWIPENMEVIAFVTSKNQNNEVLQAAVKHVVE